MQRLSFMLGFQLALTMPLAMLAAAAVDRSPGWGDARLLFTLSIAFGLLGGALLGWVLGGRPPVAGARSTASAARGVGGAALGFFVFGNVGIAIGLVVSYLVGGRTVFELVPPCSGVAGLLGLGLGRAIAR